MYYKKLNKNNYLAIVHLHQKAFNDFFLTSLGEGFLKLYYKTSLNHPDSVCVGAFDDNQELIGFCFGTIRSKGFHKRLIFKNLFKYIAQTLLILIQKPIALFRLIYNLDKKNSIVNDNGEYAELLSIGTLPNNQGIGVGKGLMIKFENEVKKKGVTKVALTTDYFNNDTVVSFYKKNGYEEFYVFTTFPQRKMYKLIKTF